MDEANKVPAPFPGMEIVECWVFRCQRCKWIWLPKKLRYPPEQCPKCKSRYWRQERKVISAEQG